MRIVIIGAGVAGLSAAWRLAKSGAQVVVLERGQPGRGATYASAGMIAATAESNAMPPGEAAFARRAQEQWPEFAAEVEAASGMSLAYRRDGVLIAAADEAEAEGLRRGANATGTVFLSAAEARAKAPMLSPNIHGALWAEDEAQVDNRALGQALAVAAVRAGAILSATEAAVQIEQLNRGGLGVRTPFRFYEADAVLLAAGAWSGEIAGLPPEAAVPVHPVKGEAIALAAPSREALPTPLLWGHGIYLVPRGDRLFVGATAVEAGFDTSPTSEARNWLMAQANALMPETKTWPVVEHWAGLRPASPDGLPILGESVLPKLFVAAGQYRNGILFAPVIADLMEELILGRTPSADVTLFSPRRFLHG